MSKTFFFFFATVTFWVRPIKPTFYCAIEATEKNLLIFPLESTFNHMMSHL